MTPLPPGFAIQRITLGCPSRCSVAVMTNAARQFKAGDMWHCLVHGKVNAVVVKVGGNVTDAERGDLTRVDAAQNNGSATVRADSCDTVTHRTAKP